MNENTKSRLASRKLWVAIGGLIAVFATEWAGLDPAMAEKIIAAVVVIVPPWIVTGKRDLVFSFIVHVCF